MGEISIEALTAQIIASSRRMSELQSRAGTVRGKGSAADERVVAEATAGGRLVGLTIDPRAMRLGSAELAEEIVRAVARAQDQAVTAAVEAVESPGADDGATAGDGVPGTDFAAVFSALEDLRRQVGF